MVAAREATLTAALVVVVVAVSTAQATRAAAEQAAAAAQYQALLVAAVALAAEPQSLAAGAVEVPTLMGGRLYGEVVVAAARSGFWEVARSMVAAAAGRALPARLPVAAVELVRLALVAKSGS